MNARNMTKIFTDQKFGQIILWARSVVFERGGIPIQALLTSRKNTGKFPNQEILILGMSVGHIPLAIYLISLFISIIFTLIFGATT